MKKNILLFFALFALKSYGVGEVEKIFGFVGGLSLAQINHETATNESQKRTGGLLGVDFELPINDHFFFTSSLYFVQKGDVTTLGTTQLNYIELLVAPKYKVSSDAMGLYFLLGPYISSILSRKFVTAGGTEIELSNVSVKNTEGGIAAGVGYELQMSHHWSVFIETKYTYGLSSAFETEKANNKAIYIDLGFHYLEREEIETDADRAEEFVKKKSLLP